MRALFLICLLLLAHSGEVYGQEKVVNEQFSETKLTRVFRILEKKYGLKIAFDVKVVSGKRITVSLKNTSIDNAFDQILKGTNLAYLKSGNNYIAIYPEKPKAPTTSAPKTYKFHGWVIEDGDEKEIPFAKIRIVGTNNGTYADEDGKFAIKTAQKNFELEVTTLGYQKRLISSKDIKSRAANKIRLKVDIIEYPEVVVEYLAEGMTTSKDVSSLAIRPHRLGATPGTIDPDVFMTIQNVPGINSANGTVSEMQIRGGTSDQNHILWEGITLYHSGHFNGMLSSLNPMIIDRAEVHRGIYDPYYGGRASGLIELASLSKIPKKVEWGGGTNLVYVDGYVKSPLGKKVALLVSARRSYVDIFKTPTYTKYADRIYQETEIRQTGTEFDESFADSTVVTQEIENEFHFLDVNAKLLIQPSKETSISMSFLHTSNQLNYQSLELEDSVTNANRFGTINLGGSFNWNQKWGVKWTSDLIVAYSRYNYEFLDSLSEQEEGEFYNYSIEKSNRVSTIGWRWKNDVKITEHSSLNFGYQGDYFQVDYGLVEREDSTVNFAESGSTNSWVNSLHANYIWKKKKWLTKIGGRVSHVSNENSLAFDPRFYGQFAINKIFTASLGIGIQNQFISQVEDVEQAQLGFSNRIWVFANDDGIPVINSKAINTGLVARWKGWHFEVDGYVKRITGIVNFADDKSMSSGFDRGNASVLGADFLIQKRWKGLRSWLTYTISEVNYTFDDEADIPETFAAPFNQPHVVKWINTLTWKNWEWSMAFKVASGKPYTQTLGVVNNPEGEPGGELDDDFIIAYAGLNEANLPAYHRLDFNVFYTIKSTREDARTKLKLGVSLLNVYNQSNYLSRTYRLEFEEDEFGNEQVEAVTIDRYYLKFTPNAVIRVEFN